ncbi:TdeIII family type II restriction endonuclease [Bacteroidota bacterium]
MLSDLQKELIAIEVIRTLYKQFEKFPEDATHNRNAPFHKAFLKAFSNKLEDKVKSIPIFISLASWMHGLNTSLGQSFLEKTAHILCHGEKREFTTTKNTALKISENQNNIINNIITELSNGIRMPNPSLEESVCFTNDVGDIDATNFTVDIFYQDDDQIVCIESKTVKPNKGVFKVEKQKVLEAKTALKNKYPDRMIKYYLGFPFDPLSYTPTGFDKQLFMDYSVGFRKYFSEDEFLLSSEMWDFLSGLSQTMESILEIINAIATTAFIDKYNFLQDKNNITDSEYSRILETWFLFREKQVIENLDIIKKHISDKKSMIRVLNQNIFSSDGSYNEKRMSKLSTYI